MVETEYQQRTTAYIKNPNNDPAIVQKIEEFKKLSSYIAGDYEDSVAFANLNSYLEDIEAHYQSKECNRIFYLALPPSVFIPVAANLRQQCYVTKGGTNRIIIEKPFGKDLESARNLLGTVKQYWTEEETFRIDHYLGKEMVKNLLVLRFANIALGASWDKNSISNVQITFKEPFGTEGRGGYFDEFGMIRDVLQNRECASIHPWARRTHALPDLLQVLSIVTMERPVSFSAEDIRDEKVAASSDSVRSFFSREPLGQSVALDSACHA
jgi:glucose-6-phosphate 1-dehydrogenase